MKAALLPFLVSRTGVLVMALVVRPGSWPDSGCVTAVQGVGLWPGAPFPLLPLLLGTLSFPCKLAGGGPGLVIALNLLLAQALFFLGLVGCWRLARRWLSPLHASRALWLLCLFPGSCQLSLGAPETLAWALLVWGFVQAEEGRSWPACALGAAATLAAPLGLLGALALAWRCERPPRALIAVAGLGVATLLAVRLGHPDLPRIAAHSPLGLVFGPRPQPWFEFGVPLPWWELGLVWGALLLAPVVESRFGQPLAGWLLLTVALPALAGGSVEAAAAGALPAWMALAAVLPERGFRLLAAAFLPLLLYRAAGHLGGLG